MGDTNIFGVLLRQYRLAASLSQELLGQRAGLSPAAIAALERGRRQTPRPSTVLLLVAGLGLAADDRAALIAAANAAQSAPPVAAVGLSSSLPAPLSSFVGRGQELADIRRQLDAVRLLTLTGAAGVGKTRLALEVARAVADEVAFVELASLADGLLVPQAVAATLGVQEQPPLSLMQTLATVLQARPLLLVLDNCEHVLPACAALVETLLRACPRLRLLATSREPLRLGGEVAWPVPALSLPDLQAPSAPEQQVASEAVRLFAERARAAQPAFALTAQNTRAVAEICVQLDGLPLAIELAAARVRALAPAQMVGRLSDRFRLLSGGSRNAPTRHRSLQAAIDWSYDLLDADEQRFLARLAIFAGGWTLEAAEEVCAGHGLGDGALPGLLGRLVDRSLVVAEPGLDGALRYRLLETIREYANERLARRGELATLSQRHRAWYRALGERALQDYWLRVDIPGWWRRLRPEQANFRAALRFSLEHSEPEAGLRLAAGLWVLWGFQGPWAEGIAWIARLLALPGAHTYPEARANALSAAGQMAFEHGDVAAAAALLLEAVKLQRAVGTARGLAMALDHAGLAASARGEFAASGAFHEEAVAVDRAAGNRGYEAVSLEAWSAGAYYRGDYAAAQRLAAASLAIVDQLDQDPGEIRVDANVTLFILGRIALYHGDAATARGHFAANLAHWRGMGDARCRPAVGALVGLGCVAVIEGDLVGACGDLAEALELSERLGSGAAQAYALEGCAIIAAAAQRPDEALCLAGAATALRAALDHPISPAERALLDRWLGPARRRLGDATAAAAWNTGLALAPRRAILRARALLSRG